MSDVIPEELGKLLIDAIDAFKLADMPSISKGEIYKEDWFVRITFEAGQQLDVYWCYGENTSCFNFLPTGSLWTEELQDKVRVALQIHLKQNKKPHEQGFWPKTNWNKLPQFDSVYYQPRHEPRKTILEARGLLPDEDGEVASPIKLRCTVVIEYLGEHNPSCCFESKHIKSTEGDQELVDHVIQQLNKVGIYNKLKASRGESEFL